ncbi:C2H2-type domain-containing protein [Mycena indigotica]|uniref:C2H2-type domain-containing protein n=1 Tax=Mycena indigotica TaxID=2126181 RepID=A0A8H6TC27_9AGAR|nr:C2H2-type domain-containing protein [Mycena indigotica]KAF7315793.1 C2H2-type domain-containing protein [Mycena indigotica]
MSAFRHHVISARYLSNLILSRSCGWSGKSQQESSVLTADAWASDSGALFRPLFRSFSISGIASSEPVATTMNPGWATPNANPWGGYYPPPQFGPPPQQPYAAQPGYWGQAGWAPPTATNAGFSTKYPTLNPVLASDTTQIRYDVRKKARADVPAHIYAPNRMLFATASSASHIRLISKAFPWSIDIMSSTPVTCEAVWDALHAGLQEHIADSEWGIIVMDKKQRETIEKAWKKRIESDSDTMLKRIDWLGSNTVCKGLDRMEEFTEVRLLPGAEACHACQDTVKKPKLEAHYNKCYSGFDCIDCSKSFHSPAEFRGHTSCISEAEKYEKSVYRGPRTAGYGNNNNSWQNNNGRGGWNRSPATGGNETPLGTPNRMSPVTVPGPEAAAAAAVADPKAQASVEVESKKEKKEKSKKEKEERRKEKKEKAAESAPSTVAESQPTKKSSKKRKHDESAAEDAVIDATPASEPTKKSKKRKAEPETTTVAADPDVSKKSSKKRKREEAETTAVVVEPTEKKSKQKKQKSTEPSADVSAVDEKAEKKRRKKELKAQQEAAGKQSDVVADEKPKNQDENETGTQKKSKRKKDLDGEVVDQAPIRKKDKKKSKSSTEVS